MVAPLIFAGWSNLHGGWIVGLGVLWLWTLGELRENRRLSSMGRRCLRPERRCSTRMVGDSGSLSRALCAWADKVLPNGNRFGSRHRASGWPGSSLLP